MNFIACRGANGRLFVRELLVVGLLTSVVCACTKNVVPTADAQGRLQGNGFLVTLPQGDSWVLKEEKQNSIVFEEDTKVEAEDRQKAPKFVHARLGVETLPAGDAQSVDDAGFPDAARAILVKRYDILSSDFADLEHSSLAKLDVTPYSKKDALCVGFRAKQVEPFKVRQSAESAAYEYLNHGFLCRHPSSKNIVVHGYINETNYRNNPRPLDPATEKEAGKFLENISFTPVH